MPRTKKVSTSIYCNRYKPNKEGLCVVSIRLHWNDSRRTYDTGYLMAAQEFDTLFPPKPTKAQADDLELFYSGADLPSHRLAAIAAFLRPPKKLTPDQKTIAIALTDEESRAISVIDKLKTGFTWERFERAYLSNVSVSNSLKGAFNDYIATLDPEKQFTTISGYESSRNSFEKFRPGAMIGDITPRYLREYEDWMLDRGKSITSVGIYCRNIRCIMNEVIREGKISRELYPFGKTRDKKYEIPAGKNPKKALSGSDIASIFNYQCEPGGRHEMARDYWIFRFLANGIDIKDFCLLKWSNLRADGIHYMRSKTINTKKVREDTVIIVTSEMLDIMRRWSNPNEAQDQHIFPHLEPGMKAKQIRDTVQNLTKLVNTYMLEITKELGIAKPAKTRDARHSFATILKNSGAPVATDQRSPSSYIACYHSRISRQF